MSSRRLVSSFTTCLRSPSRPAWARHVVNVTMANGTGDADLYTQFGMRPTLTAYNCRP